MPIDTVAIWHGVERPPQAQGSSNPTTVCHGFRLFPCTPCCAGSCRAPVPGQVSVNFTSDVETGRGSEACEVGAPGTEEACLVAAG